MILEPLTLTDMEKVRIWRHQFPETLRTPYMLTKEMQEDYYLNTICNRNSNTRYWALAEEKPWGRGDLLGYGGIEHISWENRNGELSVLIDPERHGNGLGSEAVALFLDQAFNYLNLNAVFAECYECGPIGFWRNIRKQHFGLFTTLPQTKYYNGEYYGSEVTTFSKGAYDEKHLRNPG